MRRFAGLIALPLALAGCDTNGGIGLVAKTTADVRVLNASTVFLDVVQDGKVDAANGSRAFSQSSLCMTVDIISHGLSVRPSVSHTTSTNLPSFAANERYVVVATGNGSALTVTPFRNSHTIATGKAAVRLINVGGTAASAYDVYVTDPGAALGTPGATAIGSGTASAYFDVTAVAQQIQVTANGATAVAFDLGTVTLTAGDRAVVVIAPPAAGLSTLRAFVLVIPANASC